MSGVVLERVTAQAVDENVEAFAVRVQPWYQRVELRRVESQLAAPVRVRADQLPVEPSDEHAELLPRFVAQALCLLACRVVEVHVRVVMLVDVLRPLDHIWGKLSTRTEEMMIRRVVALACLLVAPVHAQTYPA